MKYLFLLLIGFVACTDAFSQSPEKEVPILEIGKPLPDFKLTSVEDFRLGQVRASDFKGKWLILDFWNEQCSSCIQSFPEINRLQEKYKDHIQYLLIGKQTASGSIRTLYDKYKKKLGLQIAHGYDSLMFKYMDMESPGIIIVNPAGLVYGFTYKLTDDNLADLVAGKDPKMYKVYRKNEKAPSLYALKDITNEGDSSLLFQSALNKWNPLIKGSQGNFVTANRGYFEAIGQGIPELYMLAYFGQKAVGRRDSLYGQVYNRPLIETSDTLRFGDGLEDGRYCYRVNAPFLKGQKKEIMKRMQNDLRNYFGYAASIENRMVPCWNLIKNGTGDNLKTKGGRKRFQGRTDTGFTLTNGSIRDLILVLTYLDSPIFDETNITWNIDISMECMLTDVRELQTCLKMSGLDLVRGERKMKVLVLRDAKNLMPNL